MENIASALTFFGPITVQTQIFHYLPSMNAYDTLELAFKKSFEDKFFSKAERGGFWVRAYS